MNDFIDLIKERRSIRKFKDDPISQAKIDKILEAARWTPSGKNNQPWKFLIVEEDEELKKKISEKTHYSETVKNSPMLLLIFLDKEKGYDRTKDVQSIGACCQNIWLTTHSLGLGAVWNGEILNKKEEVNEILGISSDLELMALFCIGKPDEDGQSEREPLEKLIIERK